MIDGLLHHVDGDSYRLLEERRADEAYDTYKDRVAIAEMYTRDALRKLTIARVALQKVADEKIHAMITALVEKALKETR